MRIQLYNSEKPTKQFFIKRCQFYKEVNLLSMIEYSDVKKLKNGLLILYSILNLALQNLIL